MFQAKNFNFILLISLSAFFYVQAQTNYCWDPSTGTQVNCVSPNNAYCVTNYATGVGSCSATQPTNPTILYCNSGDGCNQIVTQCYNPANVSNSFHSGQQSDVLPGYIGCNTKGTDIYCVVRVFFQLSNCFFLNIY